MKKILYVAIFALLSVMLIACDKNYSFSLTIDSVNPVRNSIEVEFTINDPEGQLEDSKLTSSIYKKDSDVAVKNKDIQLDGQSVLFDGLEVDTEYTIKFFAGYDGEKITLASTDTKTTLEGTEDMPYSISTVEDFTNIVKNDANGHYKLESDIDFQGGSFDALFSSSKPFTGTFDGNGKTLKNFVYGTKETPKTITSKYYGFFGYIGNGAVVKNLTLENFDVNVTRSSSSNFGLITGYNSGLIENVTVLNSTLNVVISGYTLDGYVVGGVAASNTSGGVIKGCSVDLDLTVSAKRNVVVGGICGTNSDDTAHKAKNEISSCTYNGTIDVDITNTLESTTYVTENYVGGIIGKNYRKITNCSVNGSIDVYAGFIKPSTTEYKVSVGGLVGWNLSDNAKILDSTCSISFKVKSYDALELNVGLLAGENGGTKIPVYATINAAYTLPVEANLLIETFEEVKVNAGLVGVERVYTDNIPYTGSADITHNIYHNVVDGETTNVELKETKTINAR